MSHSDLFIGLMSGTSMDAVDAVVVSLDHSYPELRASTSLDVPADLKRELLDIIHVGSAPLHTIGLLDNRIADLFSQATETLLLSTNLQPSQVNAIGSHGQTLWHSPDGDNGFSWQIGNSARIAEKTHITTVADFRQRDIAAGGQGAPLVPAFHAAYLRDNQESRCVVNIGGMANITYLPASQSSEVLGSDTGPGNALIDWVCQTYFKCAYDKDGEFARTGEINALLLEALLSDSYFSAPLPKSTGREKFNPGWLQKHLQAMPDSAKGDHFKHDLLATVTELTAISITHAIKQHCAQTQALYVCGGGVHNSFLKSRLAHHLNGIPVLSTSEIGIDPDWMEAMAFAWLAAKTLEGLPGNLPSVTGAKGHRILGAIYPA